MPRRGVRDANKNKITTSITTTTASCVIAEKNSQTALPAAPPSGTFVRVHATCKHVVFVSLLVTRIFFRAVIIK